MKEIYCMNAREYLEILLCNGKLEELDNKKFYFPAKDGIPSITGFKIPG